MNWQIVLVPVVAALAAFITWFVQSRIEAVRIENERLYETRRGIYLKILDPTIRLFANFNNPSELKKAADQITSLEHRRAMFELNLMGSDDVVRAMNAFMQHTFHSGNDSKGMITKWSELLLAIRKDLGNKRTNIEPMGMLRNQIKDIDKYMGSRE